MCVFVCVLRGLPLSIYAVDALTILPSFCFHINSRMLVFRCAVAPCSFHVIFFFLFAFFLVSSRRSSNRVRVSLVFVLRGNCFAYIYENAPTAYTIA